MSTPDPALPEPMYLQAAALLRGRISSGEWGPHFRLPGEPDLARQLGLSRGTLRKALAELIDEGLLTRVRGRGTFVAPARIDSHLGTWMSTIADELTRLGVDFRTDVLRSGLEPAGDHAARSLGLAVGTDVVTVERLRSDESGPIVHLLNVVAVDDRRQGEALLQADLTSTPLFAAIQDRLGRVVDHGERVISAVAAGRRTARLLGLAPGAPVLHLQQTSVDADARPIEYSEVWINPERMRVQARVSRVPIVSSV